MIRHLLKLVWNRKRVNALMMIEIFLSFLVVFAVVTLAVHFWANYSSPLGFDYTQVWGIDVHTDQDYSDEVSDEHHSLMTAILREVAGFDEVQKAALADGLPYDGSTWSYSDEVDGIHLQTEVSLAGDGFDEVLGLDVVRGRWFDVDDNAYEQPAIVISRSLARELFGDADPIGKTTEFGGGGEGEKRVVGVVDTYRKSGDLSTPPNFLFRRARLDGDGRLPERIAIRVAPGVTAGFEEELVSRISAIAPRWSFEVTALDRARRAYLNETLLPLLVVGIVAGFLMLMVALGVIGVLWQNVTQRTREIGLRRAAGAARRSIHRQILTELLLITTLGLALGTITVIQVPMLQIIEQMRGPEFVVGLLVSLGLLYLLAVLCALYPSWLAARVQPAEALHYE